jgi:hypothetical protein
MVSITEGGVKQEDDDVKGKENKSGRKNNLLMPYEFFWHVSSFQMQSNFVQCTSFSEKAIN